MRDINKEKQLLLEKNSHDLYFYAKDIIKGRWPEAEPLIMTDLTWAFYYARNIINGRWPEAEPVIMKDPNMTYHYVRTVIKGRWPEAEKYLIQDNYHWNEYSKLVRNYIHKLFA